MRRFCHLQVHKFRRYASPSRLAVLKYRDIHSVPEVT